MSGGCRGWVCQFKSKEMGELKTFFYPIRIKIWFLEENEESTPRPVSVMTEEPKEDLGSPESHIGLWLVLGLVLGLMICVGIGLKKIYNFCKKGNYSICFQFFLIIYIFRLKGFILKSCSHGVERKYLTNLIPI